MLNGNGENPVEFAAPVAVPTLEAIAADPRRAVNLPRATLHALLLKSAAVQSVLTAALIASEPEAVRQPVKPAPSEGRMLTPKEAAAMLRRDRRWIYRHADSLPFVRRISSRSLLISENQLRHWLERRRL